MTSRTGCSGTMAGGAVVTVAQCPDTKNVTRQRWVVAVSGCRCSCQLGAALSKAAAIMAQASAAATRPLPNDRAGDGDFSDMAAGLFAMSAALARERWARLTLSRPLVLLPTSPGALPILLSGPGIGLKQMKIIWRAGLSGEMAQRVQGIVCFAGVYLLAIECVANGVIARIGIEPLFELLD